jgi:Na+/melibiose symporter-like transporter
MGAFCVAGVRYRRCERPVQEEAVGEVVRRVADLVRGRRDLQAFLVANALWELALAALKTFVVLYVTKTLGLSLAGSSLAIGVAASVVLVGAVVSGKIGDNLGRARVMRVALVVYGLGLLIPFASTVPWVVALAAPLVAFGGGVTMSLPYALLMPMMPRGAHGAVTRPVLAQPRRRDVAGTAPGRRRHPGGRRGLPLDVARVRRRDPRLHPGHGPAARQRLVAD